MRIDDEEDDGEKAKVKVERGDGEREEGESNIGALSSLLAAVNGGYRQR